MLILSRYAEQSIYIGDNIKIKVVGVHGNRVRIGIDAPNDVRIVREELLIGNKEQNKWPNEG